MPPETNLIHRLRKTLEFRPERRNPQLRSKHPNSSSEKNWRWTFP